MLNFIFDLNCMIIWKNYSYLQDLYANDFSYGVFVLFVFLRQVFSVSPCCP